ncbi:MFS transporter [Paenibacillus chungangensis]|uniref:MFS transporter n=1 Tax=Paenibacillus chungangensis TaxID=696535 RepID=A0ABW3HP24_9BACL
MKVKQVDQGARTITIVGGVSALALCGDSMLYVVLPIYWKEAGLDSLWQVGILLAANRFIRLPLNPLIGWLYRHMSLRTGLLAAVILGAATTIGYGLWKGFAAWLALRAVWGIAWSLMRMGGYLTVIECAGDAKRGRYMGRYNGVWRLGSLVGVLLGGMLVPIYGLAPVSILFGLLALAGIPLVLVAVKAVKTAESLQSGRPGAPGGSIWTIAVKKIVISGLVISMLHAIFSATLTYVIDFHYADINLIFGLVASSTALGGLLSALRCAWEPFLAGRFGRITDGAQGRLPLFFLSLSGAAAGFAIIPWKLPIVAWIAVVILVMMTSTALGTIMDTMAADAAKSTSVVAVMTAYSVSTDLGAALGPALIYSVIDAEYGLLATYLICSVLFVLTGAWYIREFRQRRRGSGVTLLH